MYLPVDPKEIIRTVFTFAPTLLNASDGHAQTESWGVYRWELVLIAIRVE